MNDSVERLCPICTVEPARVQYDPRNHAYFVDCPACSKVVLSGELIDDEVIGESWNNAQRAALSHSIRTGLNLPRYLNGKYPYLDSAAARKFLSHSALLPNKLIQLQNVIRFLGDFESSNGYSPPELPEGTWSLVGSASPDDLWNLVQDMSAEGLVSSDVRIIRGTNPNNPTIVEARLTLDGWRTWNELKSGNSNSKDGFIAMQFGDERLDEFVSSVIQKRVADHLGVTIHRVDSPGKARAGLIDNIMREAIEDAAFVLVDLSHGNRGAYWEAGLAEGLRKPVIYLCEQCVWDDPTTRPHFDVNHRTTVMWDEGDPDDFIKRLVSTIKNSLRHHYSDT